MFLPWKRTPESGEEWRMLGASDWLCGGIRFVFRMSRLHPEMNAFFRHPYPVEPNLKVWVREELNRLGQEWLHKRGEPGHLQAFEAYLRCLYPPRSQEETHRYGSTPVERAMFGSICEDGVPQSFALPHSEGRSSHFLGLGGWVPPLPDSSSRPSILPFRDRRSFLGEHSLAVRMEPIALVLHESNEASIGVSVLPGLQSVGLFGRFCVETSVRTREAELPFGLPKGYRRFGAFFYPPRSKETSRKGRMERPERARTFGLDNRYEKCSLPGASLESEKDPAFCSISDWYRRKKLKEGSGCGSEALHWSSHLGLTGSAPGTFLHKSVFRFPGFDVR